MTKIRTSAKRTRVELSLTGDSYRDGVRVSLLVAWLGVVAVFAVVAGPAGGEPAAFRAVVAARGFDAPVLVTWAPGEQRNLYVVEQSGKVVRLAGGRRTVFLDATRLVDFGGERGLLGFAFDPGYARNRLFYIAYTTSDRNVVARFRSNGRAAVASSRRILLSVEDPYSNHNGGHLAFGRDGRLYTTIGDGGAGGDPENRSQDMSSFFGKLLRLDVSKPMVRWEIVGLGLRNAWRFSFDRATGDLYLGDVGQNAVEEVSFTPASSPGLENYGWNAYEGSQRFSDVDLGPGRLVAPIFEYEQSEGGCSVIGGYVYRGRARPAERGRYLVGDYCTGIVWSMRVRNGRATGTRREPFRVPGLTSFGENAAGEIYATRADGVVLRRT
jgi:glucose/arabinose dehydrogenase